MEIIVEPYSIDTLIKFLSEYSKSDLKNVKNKRHIEYLEEYLSEIKAKTIVIETEYIDKYFLDDYAALYVKCFTKYNKLCCRIHFFSNSFKNIDFDNYLKNKSENISLLQDNYLGYIVIKPLPEAIIGTTCLNTYPTKNTKRKFPTTRIYNPSICGIRLTLDTLAYQEQDTVAAACATSALWSSYQKTSMLFQHKDKSPIEITRDATSGIPYRGRCIPSHGLTVEQMAESIRKIGLEPLYYPNIFNNYQIFLNIIYAYLNFGVPLILGGNLLDFSKKRSGDLIGLHAVTIVGYSIDDKTDKLALGLNLKANSVDQIYVHDDQLGPFARMRVINKFKNYSFLLSTSWKDYFGKVGNVYMDPIDLLVPIYHKIRIPFIQEEQNKSIYGRINTISIFIELLKSAINTIPHIRINKLKWDISLSLSSDFKSDILKNTNLISETHKLALLKTHLPKYIWKAIVYEKETLFELIFDATDFERSNFYLLSVLYNNDFTSNASKFLTDNIVEYLLSLDKLPFYWSDFIKSFQKELSSI